MIETPAYDAALRGAAVLDEAVPDWRQRIDCDALDMLDPVHCVLGQLYGGNYGAGIAALHAWMGSVSFNRFHDTLMAHLGFDTPATGEYFYTDLTDAWRELLDHRSRVRVLIDSLATRVVVGV